MTPAPAVSATKSPAATPAAPAMAPKRLTNQELLKRFDKNGDGKIDDDERADAKEEMVQEQVARQMQQIQRAATVPGGQATLRAIALEMFDKNRDGQLDDDERAAARQFAEQHALSPGGEVREELRKRFDKNANGQIDDNERAAFIEFLKERRAATSSLSTPERREEEKKQLEAVAAEVAKRREAREKAKEPALAQPK